MVTALSGNTHKLMNFVYYVFFLSAITNAFLDPFVCCLGKLPPGPKTKYFFCSWILLCFTDNLWIINFSFDMYASRDRRIIVKLRYQTVTNILALKCDDNNVAVSVVSGWEWVVDFVTSIKYWFFDYLEAILHWEYTEKL